MRPRNRLHSKDTSKDGEHTTSCNGDHAHRDSEGLEEELKLLIREFGAEVVHKCMNLAQAKHTECLQGGRGETFSCGIVVLIQPHWEKSVCMGRGGGGVQLSKGYTCGYEVRE